MLVYLLLFLLPGFFSFFLYKKYINIACTVGLLSRSTVRELHSGVTPRGAGVINYFIFVLFLSISVLMGVRIPGNLVYLISAVTIFTLYGLADDKYFLSASFKLLAQLITVSLLLYFINIHFINSHSLTSKQYLIPYLYYFFIGFCLLWYLNSFNFIDGSDLFATFSALTIFLPAVIVFYFNSDLFYMNLCIVNVVCLLIFILFNKSPAKLFMGEAGSCFLSSVILFIVIHALNSHFTNLVFWLILSSYYLSDTSFTTCYRMIKYPKRWYHEHRSHAYQNLARIKGHMFIAKLVGCYNIVWLIPLAFLSYFLPHYKILFLLLAYIPTLLFCVRFGPLYQDV